jgi:hypothetical protein
MPETFWVESGELWMTDEHGPPRRWRPDGRSVHSVIAIPGANDAVVLLDWCAEPQGAHGQRKGFANLLRVTRTMDIVWRASAPESGDCWVAVIWEVGRLWGISWSGWRVELDPVTAREIARVFTK